MLFFHWLQSYFIPRPTHRRRHVKSGPSRRFQPCLEVLEERAVPATVTVQNSHRPASAGLLRGGRSASAASGDTIDFAPGGLIGGQTITLSSGSLSPAVNVTITDAGAPGVSIVSAGSRVFDFTNPSLTSVTLVDLTLQGAASDGNIGGAILSDVGSSFALTVTDCSIVNSSSTAGGGAIGSDSGTLNIIGSTISGNTSSARGGGVDIESGIADATNTTIAGNTANSGGGGGIAIAGGILYLTNCTISGNNGSNASGGGLDVLGAGAGATADVMNTIIAGNTDGSGHDYDLSQDSFATINAYTSLIQNVAANIINGDNFFNVIGQSAMLNPLANYGGPTETMSLQADSPAIDAGGNSHRKLATDQRGYARPQGATVDIGAFELRKTVTIVSGNNQSAETDTNFQLPLEIQVTSPDLNGAVIADQAVTFTVESVNGAGVLFRNSTTEVTDSNGEASVRVKANDFAGSYTVDATLGSSSAPFALSNTSGNTAAAYNSSYDAYVYAYDAYVTTGNAYAYVAMNYAYSSFYYAYYAYYYSTVNELANSENCAYYAYYYAATSAYYSSYVYSVTGNVYANYAYYYSNYAETESFNAALGQ